MQVRDQDLALYVHAAPVDQHIAQFDDVIQVREDAFDFFNLVALGSNSDDAFSYVDEV